MVAGPDLGLSFHSPLGNLIQVSHLSVPQTKLEYSRATSSGCCRECEGQAPRMGQGQVCGSYCYLCDLDASHLGQVSPHWLGGKSQHCPGMWACFGGKNGLLSQRGFILLCNLGM